MRSVFALTVVVVLPGVLAVAGDKGKIAGRVTDAQSGEHLAGANVFIKGTPLGASTDVNGEYFILNVHPGLHNVTISFIGYRTMTRTDVLVNADRTTPLDVALEPVAVEAGEVIVTANRPLIAKDLTASEQVLTGQELQKSWVRTVTEAVETQAGVFQSYFRGSSQLQAVYMIDNLATNSGLLSDNYSSFNTSTIQEISVLTGGYNAEYGDARSAVINIVTKEATSGIHGSALVRRRPAGIYHFGRHIYSKENYDYAFYDLNYWTARSRDTISTQFYGIPPESLLAAWRRQITPNDTLANYDKRPEYEVEGTIFGAVSEELSFLVSGRYKRGVGIFPQAIPYNPEFNIQGYVSYKISPGFKVRVGGFWGGWESAEYLGVNFNSLESAQESQWLAPMQITTPYSSIKYSPMGAIYRQWPELRRWEQYYLKITHLLNPESFYDLSFSYLHDQMDRSDRYNAVPDQYWSRRDDQMKTINRFLDRGYFHTWDKNFSKVFQLKADFTGQMTTHHQVKSGFTMKFYDFSYEHFMGVHEGGNRWNLLNVFAGHPYEGNLYVQDKVEFPGLIVNGGVRVDYFHQNRLAPKNLFDPLAFQPTTPGHDPSKPLGYPGNPELERTKPQVVVAPRLGISHPISENTVLHFVYGHFYQRPSWTKMFGFPFVNYTTDMSKVLDPYADQITYMEEWQGWYGNSAMGFERTIHYELGVDNNIADILKLDITGYYKDGNREANVITGVYAAQYIATKALMMSNSGYSDIRGIETKLDTRFRGPLNAGISHDILWSFAGEVGYSQLYEEGSTRVNVPKGLRQSKGAWSSYHKVKAWLNLSFEPEGGPDLGGIRPLSDFNLYVYTWWRSGDPYTYHGPGDVSTEPNNRRWFNLYQTNVKVSKGLSQHPLKVEISLEVRNVFNSKFLRLLGGDDLIRWHENPHLPERERLPRNSFSGEPNEWEWYSYEVPPRKVYFQIGVSL